MALSKKSIDLYRSDRRLANTFVLGSNQAKSSTHNSRISFSRNEVDRLSVKPETSQEFIILILKDLVCTSGHAFWSVFDGWV